MSNEEAKSENEFEKSAGKLVSKYKCYKYIMLVKQACDK